MNLSSCFADLKWMSVHVIGVLRICIVTNSVDITSVILVENGSFNRGYPYLSCDVWLDPVYEVI